ncbi:lipid-A-disaccharide synthase N-terminal domain-containing protein [bacterium]|nr:lipid-A-disaccharide synthase N-terminal domain-containing protein [bacterium]
MTMGGFEITAWTLFGFCGNLLFTARVLLQWIASERQRRSVVPVAFWWLSWLASIIMIVYAYRRGELPFVLGFAVTLVPYTRNLLLHYRPRSNPAPIGLILAAAVVLGCVPVFVFYEHEAVKDAWTWLGLLGNAVFGSRFFVQWVRSESEGRSVLPLSFWYVSLLGGTILLAYSLIRGDLVFILGYLFTVVPYARNIVLLRRQA